MGILVFRAPNQGLGEQFLLDCRAMACAKGIISFTDAGITKHARQPSLDVILGATRRDPTPQNHVGLI